MTGDDAHSAGSGSPGAAMPASRTSATARQPAPGHLASGRRAQPPRRHRRRRCRLAPLPDLATRAGPQRAAGRHCRRGAPRPPRIIRGDLVDDLAALAAQAPSQATLVVFHSAVLVYVSPPRRRDFAAAVSDLDAPLWLSDEAAGILPDLINQPTPPPGTDPFVLALCGRITRSSALSPGRRIRRPVRDHGTGPTAHPDGPIAHRIGAARAPWGGRA